MKLRIGIIGSGFASEHVKSLSLINEVTVAAISSRNEKKARDIVKGKNTNYYSLDNYLEMLEHEKLDAVYICLPPFLNDNIALTCSKYVKAIFIEKPATLNIEKGKKALNAFNKKGTLVSVGYMNRYRETVQKAKHYFKLDKPVLINASWCDKMPPPYWWRQKNESGGQLTEQCTHFIDTIRYIAGEIIEVSAYATNGFIDDVENFNVEDAVIMNFRTKSGVIGNVMTSCFTKNHGGGALGLFLNISSREKTYRFTNHTMDLQIQHKFEKLEILMSNEDAILEENRSFIKAIINNDESLILSTYKDALETAKVGLAADLSIREKRIVKLGEL